MNKSIKIKFVLVALLVVSFGTGCKKDFLNTEPTGTVLEGNYYKTQQDAIYATNAIYNILRSWEVHVFAYIGLTDIISDDADKGSTPDDALFLKEIDDFAFSSSNTAPTAVWKGYYRGIQRANQVITRVPAISMDETLKNRLVGEAKFLRAHFYFNLVQWFGDIPLITRPLELSELKQARVPAAQVYEQIIQDLKDAVDVLPLKSAYNKDTDLGRATKGAAQGMLAKVYLTMGDFPNALQYSLEVINSNQYDLYPDYAKLFREEAENGVESLFEVQATANEQGNGGTQYNEVQGVRGTPNLGWGFNRPSDDLIKSYESGDPRRTATIIYEGEVLPDGSTVVQPNPAAPNSRYNKKAWVPTHTGANGNGPTNIKILRYADILLTAAESANELGQTNDALTYLNKVRKRARGQNPNILKDVTETDKDKLRDRIWKERRSEFAMEQKRWFDLVRQKRAGSVMQAVGKNFVIGKHELMPIPQSEIDLSEKTLTQNNGY